MSQSAQVAYDISFVDLIYCHFVNPLGLVGVVLGSAAPPACTHPPTHPTLMHVSVSL